jgi:hypothetical protein
MLTLDKDRQFIVYPSWVNLPYPWDYLPEILSDPGKSGFLPANIPRAFPTPPPQIDYLNGPAGGGIIVVHQPRHRPAPDIDNPALAFPVSQWLGTLVLVSEANLRTPNGCGLAGPFASLVTYLEPYEYPEEVQLGLRPRPKLYLCATTPEHVASAGTSIFWLAALERRKRRPPALAELPGWASAFGLSVAELEDIPERLRSETAGWFGDPPAFDDVWYQVSGGGNSVGFHFAVLVYLALHTRSVVKPLQAMHLVANIEGGPLYRKTWHRR